MRLKQTLTMRFSTMKILIPQWFYAEEYKYKKVSNLAGFLEFYNIHINPKILTITDTESTRF